MSRQERSRELEPNGPDAPFFDGAIYDFQFACLYDRDDIGFWAALAAKQGPRVLELACGTGRISIPIALAGASLHALDFSKSMLQVARRRAAANRLPIRFHHRDMRQLRFDREFDLAILPAGSFMHLLGAKDVGLLLDGVHRALSPGGRFCFDLHNPGGPWLSSLRIGPRKHVQQFATSVDNGDTTVASETSYRTDLQMVTVQYRYTFNSGATREGTVTLKVYSLPEIHGLLQQHGFAIDTVHGAHDGRPLAPDSPWLVVLARQIQSATASAGPPNPSLQRTPPG